jgi:hypothetical protein
MTTPSAYPNHPLLPLMQLLDRIATADEFNARRDEILEAIHLAKAILKDRTPELTLLAKGPYLKRQGAPSTPFRMARLVETRIKETLQLGSPETPPSTKRNRKPKQAMKPSRPAAPAISMTYRQLCDSLPTVTTIPTLGGRADIEIHNPAGGYLVAINSRGKRYHVTEANWNHANAIRRANPVNPWASQLYNNYHFQDDHGLYHAAGILRAIEEGDLPGFDDLEAA